MGVYSWTTATESDRRHFCQPKLKADVTGITLKYDVL
jgi:hypothetical protein